MPEAVSQLEDSCSSSDTSSVKCALVMTSEQKDWLLACLMCNQLKLTGMLAKNAQLANWKNYFDGNTALHYAAKFGDCGIIRLLAGNYNADVNVRNNAGLTPLHLAAEHARLDAVILLTSAYGANTCIRDCSGKLPSAYLPSTKEGQALKRFFKDPTLLLAHNQKNFIYLLLENPPREYDRQRSASNSPARTPRNFPTDSNGGDSEGIQSHLPINTQFPWQTSGFNSDESLTRRPREHSLTRLGRHLRGRGSADRSREPSQERQSSLKKKRALDQVASMASLSARSGARRPTDISLLPARHTGFAPKRYTARQAGSTRQATAAGTNLADDIYASVRRKRELTGPIYNPLCPEQRNKEGNTTVQSPVSARIVGRRRGILSLYDVSAVKTAPDQRVGEEPDVSDSGQTSTPVDQTVPNL